MNEVTFVGKLGAFTSLRAAAAKAEGEITLIALGDLEESQEDASGSVKRCDMRLAAPGGRKLVSGEMKRPELAEGRDPRNMNLVADARNKAVSKGLPLYFTCNMATAVLYEVSMDAGQPDRELADVTLAPVSHSSEVASYLEDIQENWNVFLDHIEQHLSPILISQPPPTSADVVRLRVALERIAQESLGRARQRLLGDPAALEQTRSESAEVFGFPFPLNPSLKSDFDIDLEQILRLSAFVVAQKLILHRVLADTGGRLKDPFQLDPVQISSSSTEPTFVKSVIDAAIAQAIKRSGDYETAFLLTPNETLLFLDPGTVEEVASCEVGESWANLVESIEAATWSAISHNLIGFLYEAIVDPEYRHALGQHYTQENVVDLLTAFAIEKESDTILDPSAGGGSFLRSAYRRKRDLGATHAEALSEIWGTELSAFAAELSTVTLATSDPSAPSAYPRVVIADFFDLRPGAATNLETPESEGPIPFPSAFDGIVGNPPYISYRHQTNQQNVLTSLATLPDHITLPQFSGKSDEYAWFLIHATQFLKPGGRLGFVVSSAILFSDYGIPLIRFLARYYKIRAVVDSMVERWFVDADTNTVLLLLEREDDSAARESNQIRFTRLRRPLTQLLSEPLSKERRQSLEDLTDLILESEQGDSDPKLTVVTVEQGVHGGLAFADEEPVSNLFESEES